MNECCSSLHIPIRTRIFHRALSLLGFVLEQPCLTKNKNRYLVLYDNFTASYHSDSEFHLCLCQDFRRHLLNIDYKELRSHYQHAFENLNTSMLSNYPLDSIIRVRKFGAQYHNVRVIDIDCSIIKICFFERKSKKEMWIHSNSSIIEPSSQVLQSTTLAIHSEPQTPTEEIVNSYSDLSRLRKRKNNTSNINKGIHRKDFKTIVEISLQLLIVFQCTSRGKDILLHFLILQKYTRETESNEVHFRSLLGLYIVFTKVF
jgi:hypothetical protein